MSPKSNDDRPRGSGPDGRIEITDIQGKLEEIQGDIEAGTDRAKPIATYAAVGAVVVIVVVTFMLGRRRGRRKSTWVEIRRL